MSIHWRDIQPGGWQWLEDYIFLRAVYVVGCPPDRRCRVGSGVFVAGRPLGDQYVFSGDQQITVFGAGALHVKVEDDKGPCRVGFYRLEANLIPIYPPPL